MTDWPTTLADFHARFAGRMVPRNSLLRPTGVTGVNVMTPDVLGYIAGPDGPVEVSTGTGLFGGRIFGVTFGRMTNSMPDERDTMCETLAEVEAVIFPEVTA